MPLSPGPHIDDEDSVGERELSREQPTQLGRVFLLEFAVENVCLLDDPAIAFGRFGARLDLARVEGPFYGFGRRIYFLRLDHPAGVPRPARRYRCACVLAVR